MFACTRCPPDATVGPAEVCRVVANLPEVEVEGEPEHELVRGTWDVTQA